MTTSNKPYSRIIQIPAEHYLQFMNALVAINRKEFISQIKGDGKGYRIRAKLKEEEVILLKLKFPIDVKMTRRNRGFSKKFQ